MQNNFYAYNNVQRNIWWVLFEEFSNGILSELNHVTMLKKKLLVKVM